MPWIDDLKQKSAFSVGTPLPGFGQVQVGQVAQREGLTGSRVKDAATLREWRETIPLINRGVNWRRRCVANEPFQVGPTKPNITLSPKQETLAEQIETFLHAPNAQAQNNSWGGLVEPFVDDLFTVGLGGILIQRSPKSRIPTALECLDGARLEFDPNWDGSPTSARYRYLDEDGLHYKPLRNDEAMVVVFNPTSYCQTGIAPLRVLYRTLTAYLDLFQRMQTIQRHGGPASLVNIAGAGRENLATIRRRYENEVEPNSSVMFTDFDVDDLKLLQLGAIDLQKAGTFQFHDILVREVACCLDVAPLYLMQEQDTHLSSATEQTRMTSDDGLPPVLRLISGYVSREIVAAFGDPELALLYPSLLTDDEPESADATRARFGKTGGWLSINAALVADGLEPIESTGDTVVDAWLNEPRVAIGNGDVQAPISIAAKLPMFQPGQPAQPAEAVPPSDDGAAPADGSKALTGTTSGTDRLQSIFDALMDELEP